MYQTVGHDVVQLYEGAMGLPLYRQAIHGTNLEQQLHYNTTAGDETEDLYKLLHKVVVSAFISCIIVLTINSRQIQELQQSVLAPLRPAISVCGWKTLHPASI